MNKVLDELMHYMFSEKERKELKTLNNEVYEEKLFERWLDFKNYCDKSLMFSRFIYIRNWKSFNKNFDYKKIVFGDEETKVSKEFFNDFKWYYYNFLKKKLSTNNFMGYTSSYDFTIIPIRNSYEDQMKCLVCRIYVDYGCEDYYIRNNYLKIYIDYLKELEANSY